MALRVYWTLVQILARVTRCNGKSPQKVNSDSGLHDTFPKIVVFQFCPTHITRFILGGQPGVPSVSLTQHLDSQWVTQLHISLRPTFGFVASLHSDVMCVGKGLAQFTQGWA